MKRPTSNIIAALHAKEVIIAAIALAAIVVHLILRFGVEKPGAVVGLQSQDIPLLLALTSGIPLVVGLVIRLSRLEFSSDLLAGISIVTSVILGEYLAGTLVVLMLSGGQALEAYAVRRASFALEALARRMPSLAHRKKDGAVGDVASRRGRGRRCPRGLPARNLSGRWCCARRPQHHERIVSDRRTVSLAQGHWVDGPLRGHQRRRGIDDSGGENGRRFALRQDHAGHARVGTAETALAAARRSDRRRLHPAGSRHRPHGLGLQRRRLEVSGRAGGRDALPAADCHSGGDHRLRFVGGAAWDHHQGPGRAGEDRHLPHRHLRQDGHADLRAAEVDRGSPPGRHWTKDATLAAVASLERYSRHPLASAILEAADAAKLPLAGSRKGQRDARAKGWSEKSVGG